LAILARLGWPYLLLSVLMFVTQAGAVLAGGMLADVLPWVIEDLAVSFVWFWGLFATCHLMGYLIWQFHGELGYQPATLQGDASTLADPDRDLLDRVEMQLASGDASGGLASLREAIGSRAVGMEVHARYRQLLQGADDVAALRAHDAPCLHRILMEPGNRMDVQRRALATWREALEANSAFVPLDPGHGVRLAEIARANGQHDLALDGLLALLAAHPGHADAPRWGLDAALVQVERHARDAEGRELLERARARCTDPALAERIDSLLTLLRATTV